MVEWIKTSERLPDKLPDYPISDPCLVCVTYLQERWLDLLIYHFELGGWISDVPGMILEECGITITHWSSDLPALPEE